MGHKTLGIRAEKMPESRPMPDQEYIFKSEMVFSWYATIVSNVINRVSKSSILLCSDIVRSGSVLKFVNQNTTT